MDIMVTRYSIVNSTFRSSIVKWNIKIDQVLIIYRI